MRGDERCHGCLAQYPFLGGMLQCELGELGCFLSGELSTCGVASAGIRNGRQSSTPNSKSPDDERDGAGMAPSKGGIDRANDLPSHGTLCSGEQLQLGRVDRPDRAAGGARSIALQLEGFGDLSVFWGSLARPVQGSRYWSRSHPLPRSRSFQ